MTKSEIEQKIAISIHALRGEGDCIFCRQSFKAAISIHALRGEGDGVDFRHFVIVKIISIHALRGEGDAYTYIQALESLGISIHALRGEGDSTYALNNSINAISIHALRGEGDRRYPTIWRDPPVFQSTPSVGRATVYDISENMGLVISIHALRGEGDLLFGDSLASRCYFNPRPPWGGRRSQATPDCLR